MIAADELIIDSFAGGGGASTGIEWAIGRSPDIAINHDADALAMHEANHPHTLHLRENVWHARLRDLIPDGRRVGLLWASPDCKHFSRAKGSKPVDKSIRSLAWIVVRWASQVRPRVIILENVREFADWGPVVPLWRCSCGWKGTEGQARLARTRRRCPRCDSARIKATDDLTPDPDKKGMTFRLFVNRLRGHGYKVEWRNLNAADYGAPTHRRRLFLIARCDGQPIEWPEPTHGDPEKLNDAPLFDRLLPWRTAAECIDWNIPCPSIFDRKKPLAEKTLRRIALGIKRYVLDNPQPFIVPITHAGERRSYGTDEPAPTCTTAHRGEHAIVTPVVTKYHHSKTATDDRCQPVAEPASTLDTQPRFGIIAPTLIQTGYGEREGQSPRTLDIEEPLGTVVSGGAKHAVICPTLIGAGGSEYAAKPRPADQPFPVVKCDDRRAVAAAYIVKHFGGMVGVEAETPLPTTLVSGSQNQLVAAHITKFRGDSMGVSIEQPMPTVTSGEGSARPAGAPHALAVTAANLVRMNHGEQQASSVDEPLQTVTTQHNKSQLVATNLVHLNHGDKQWSPVDEPHRAITANGKHAALVYSFLVKYFGTAIAANLIDPLPTATGNDRFGLVTVTIAGELYYIADIGMRMLTPRELATAQGFPAEYILTGTKTSQVARIGNSVCPPVAAALAGANCRAEACV